MFKHTLKKTVRFGRGPGFLLPIGCQPDTQIGFLRDQETALKKASLLQEGGTDLVSKVNRCLHYSLGLESKLNQPGVDSGNG